MTGLRYARRMLREPDPRLLWALLRNAGFRGIRGVRQFNRRLARGTCIPAFLFVSVTDACNLACRGCWVAGHPAPRTMDAETLARIIGEGNAEGCFFFGILGGEPLLHAGLLDVLARYPESYFLLFTNGTLIDDTVAERLRRARNISPLISIEGGVLESDRRRGSDGVLERSLQGLECCRRHRLVVGVASSVCRDNFQDVVSEAFIHDLARRGVHFLWYYIYRPVGLDPAPELALDAAGIHRLRSFMVAARRRAPLVLLDTYWDHDGLPLCPAVTGIGYHINPAGAIEPCPPIQFACETVHDGRPLGSLFNESTFLARFRTEIARVTRGCVLLEQPALLARLVDECGARDSSGRSTGREELARRIPVPGHGRMPAIPEANRMYHFAKRHWFFGFGAYG